MATMIESLVLAEPAPTRARRVRTPGRRGGPRPDRADRVTDPRARERRGPGAMPDDAARDRRGRSSACVSGGVVAMPTDTVYGIAVALATPGGIERLFEVKRRPPDKGIVLLLADPAQAADDRRDGSGRHRPRRGLLARRPHGRRAAAGRRRPAGGPHGRRSRRSACGSPTTPRRGRSRRPSGRCRRRRRTGAACRRAATRTRSRPSSAATSTSSSTAVRPTAVPRRRSSTAPATGDDRPRRRDRVRTGSQPPSTRPASPIEIRAD